MVSEDGREYYAVSAEYDPERATEWLAQHVLPLLGSGFTKSHQLIRDELEIFFSVDTSPEFWAECGEYDWIVLRQLFGTITDWPSGWPYLAMDIEQWRIQLGAPPFPAQQTGLHNALADARNARDRWNWLVARCKGDSEC